MRLILDVVENQVSYIMVQVILQRNIEWEWDIYEQITKMCQNYDTDDVQPLCTPCAFLSTTYKRSLHTIWIPLHVVQSMHLDFEENMLYRV